MMLSTKPVYNQLVTKVIAIDAKIPSTSTLVTKSKYDSHKQVLQKKNWICWQKDTQYWWAFQEGWLWLKLKPLKTEYPMSLD